MTALTEAELSDLEALCEAATPGPLQVVDMGGTYEVSDARRELNPGCWGVVVFANASRQEDAAFIAASRTAVPRLIAELRAERAAQQGRRRVITASERRAMIAVSPEDERLAATAESPEREARLRFLLRRGVALANDESEVTARSHPAPPQGPEPGGTSTDALQAENARLREALMKIAYDECQEERVALAALATPDAGEGGKR